MPEGLDAPRPEGLRTPQEPASDKTPVTARFVKLLRHVDEERNMVLIPELSRCLLRGELHEIVLTDEDPAPDGCVKRVGFLGFVEIADAGVVESSDETYIAGRRVGCVVGFDACHFPNHYNVVIRAQCLLSATELDLSLHDELVFA